MQRAAKQNLFLIGRRDDGGGHSCFGGKEIRKTLHNDEWWFVVEDVVLALIDSTDPKQYIQRMKQRDPELGKGWVQIVHTLSVDTPGGRNGWFVPIQRASSAVCFLSQDGCYASKEAVVFCHSLDVKEVLTGNERLLE